MVEQFLHHKKTTMERMLIRCAKVLFDSKEEGNLIKESNNEASALYNRVITFYHTK